MRYSITLLDTLRSLYRLLSTSAVSYEAKRCDIINRLLHLFILFHQQITVQLDLRLAESMKATCLLYHWLRFFFVSCKETQCRVDNNIAIFQNGKGRHRLLLRVAEQKQCCYEVNPFNTMPIVVVALSVKNATSLVVFEEGSSPEGWVDLCVIEVQVLILLKTLPCFCLAPEKNCTRTSVWGQKLEHTVIILGLFSNLDYFFLCPTSSYLPGRDTPKMMSSIWLCP